MKNENNSSEILASYYEIICDIESKQVSLTEDLIMRYKDGESYLREEIVNSCLKMVYDLVTAMNIDDEIKVDLIQEGNMCVASSIMNYSSDRGDAVNYFKYIVSKRMVRSIGDRSYFNVTLDDGTEFDNEFIYFLKETLSSEIFNIIYNSVIGGRNIIECASKLGISLEKAFLLQREGILYINENKERTSVQYGKIKESFLRDNKKDKLRLKPIDIDEVLLYLYLGNELNVLEKNLLYQKIFGKYDYSSLELCAILKVSTFRYLDTNKKLTNKINEVLISDEFIKFLKLMKLKYGYRVFDLVNIEREEINFLNIKRICDQFSFSEIKEMIGENISSLNSDELLLLEKFFGSPLWEKCDVERIEREVNLAKYGFNRKEHRLEPQKVYPVYLENINEFNEEQILFLECYYFKIKDKKIFKETYPLSSLDYRHQYLIDRLERLYYGIYRILDNNFNKEKYLYVKENYGDKLTTQRIKILDMAYGVDGVVYSIQEIADYLGVDYIKGHDLISDAREYCINLYANRSNRIDIDKSIYIPYLDSKYDFTVETRSILKMFLIEGLSYDEISLRTKLTKYRISNIITDGIRKIDNYRFRINTLEEISLNDLNNVFELYKDSFSLIEKMILTDRFVEKMENKEIALKRKIDIKEVNKYISHFNRLYLKYRIKDVTLTDDDIKSEIDRHISSSVISEESKKLLSLYYGIKCKYNLKGEKISSDEIQKRFGITKNVFYHNCFLALDSIKARKIGLLKPELEFIDRDEMNRLLDLPNLPISDKEREIICYLFELKGYPYKKINEISELYGESRGASIRRRYYRAIVSIKKYLNNEIEGQINYEKDIKPILKYFSVSDKTFINLYYRDSLTYEELANKFGISFDKVVAILGRVKINIYDILHDKKCRKFDFDYYKKAILDERLPFYGNLDTATKIFDLYFGMSLIERVSAPKIIEILNLNWKTSAINNCINLLMLSVCKLKDGIYRQREFSLDEIGDYYVRNSSLMNIYHLEYYRRYFDMMSREGNLNGAVSRISDVISYDLIKDIYDDCFKLESTSKEDAIKLLRDDRLKISASTRKGIMTYFGIRYSDLMNGKEKNHVYRLINNLVKRNILVFHDEQVLQLLKKD